MIDRVDFTKPPARRGPRERLFHPIRRAEGDPPRRPYADRPIESVVVSRLDRICSLAMEMRTVRISLPRVRFIEGDEP